MVMDVGCKFSILRHGHIFSLTEIARAVTSENRELVLTCDDGTWELAYSVVKNSAITYGDFFQSDGLLSVNRGAFYSSLGSAHKNLLLVFPHLAA